MKELIDNEKVDLSSVNHVVLDDVDQMLESETSENVKKVLKQTFSSGRFYFHTNEQQNKFNTNIQNLDRENKAQLVVLSQTSPDSFRKLIKKYLSDEAVTVNLADDESDEVRFSNNIYELNSLVIRSIRVSMNQLITHQQMVQVKLKMVQFHF